MYDLKSIMKEFTRIRKKNKVVSVFIVCDPKNDGIFEECEIEYAKYCDEEFNNFEKSDIFLATSLVRLEEGIRRYNERGIEMFIYNAYSLAPAVEINTLTDTVISELLTASV